MRRYIDSESKRRQRVAGRFPYRIKRRVGKWARLNLYNIGSAFSDPMVAGILMLSVAAMVAALLLPNADFANPAIGMPVTIAIFGLGIAGYNIGVRSSQRAPRRVR